MVAELLLILLLTDLLAIALAGKRFFHTLLLTWFQIKRVTLDFLDNVFRLHLAFETSQGVLKGFAFLYSNLCQENTPPNIPNGDCFQNTPVDTKKITKIAGNLRPPAASFNLCPKIGPFSVKSAPWSVLTRE